MLLFGGLLLSAPFLWQAWTSGHELDGKVAVFDAASSRPANALLECLVQRPDQGLKLSIVAENHFADSARGIAVRIEPRGDGQAIKAWITSGRTLTAGEAAQLRGCTAG